MDEHALSCQPPCMQSYSTVPCHVCPRLKPSKMSFSTHPPEAKNILRSSAMVSWCRLSAAPGTVRAGSSVHHGFATSPGATTRAVSVKFHQRTRFMRPWRRPLTSSNSSAASRQKPPALKLCIANPNHLSVHKGSTCGICPELMLLLMYVSWAEAMPKHSGWMPTAACRNPENSPTRQASHSRTAPLASIAACEISLKLDAATQLRKARRTALLAEAGNVLFAEAR
mmetsp:Transcript_81111/g.224465  ORF Transcript_81111/g.224465 Transcript_81111/m.224465 type:complete len:226 (-) Transcript_81111:139-816(-)